MGTAPSPPRRRPWCSQGWEPAGGAVLLLALTAVAFSAPFQVLAPDQRVAHGLALAAAGAGFVLALFSVGGKRVRWAEPTADAALLLAQLGVVWLLVDLLCGDLLATVAVVAMPAGVVVAIAALARHASGAGES